MAVLFTSVMEGCSVCSNKMGHRPRFSLFENRDGELTESDISSFLAEGRLFLTKFAREKGSYTEALRLLSHVLTPEASFQTALVVHWLSFLNCVSCEVFICG